MADDQKPDRMTYRESFRVAAMAIPFILLAGIVFWVVFRPTLHDQRSDVPVSSIVAIAIASIIVSLFQEHLRRPSRALAWATGICYLLVALLLWARITDHLPHFLVP
jgi:Ca2+/Na+ antiporter